MAFKDGVLLGPVNINATGSATTTINGVVNIGTDNTTNAITIGTGTGGRQIDIGFSAANHGIRIGVNNGTTAVSVLSGSGGIDVNAVSGNVEIDGSTGVFINSAASTLNIGDDADAFGINIGTGAAARTITIGNTTGATAVNVRSGAGGIGLTGVVTSANAITVTAGNITASSGNVVITSGNLTFPNTTSTPTGAILMAGNRFMHGFGSTTVGSSNTFLGRDAGNFTLTTGALRNVGLGAQSLQSLSTGDDNTGCGVNTLNACSTGGGNTAIGTGALQVLSTGSNNVAIGRTNGLSGTLGNLDTGSNNIAVGAATGTSYTGAESSNILIGNTGTVGESNVMRLGTAGGGVGQVNQCFIAGITGISTGGASNVPYIDANGKLGTTAGGAITMNTGTQSLTISGDASATTVNIASGGAAKTVQLGSTNGASSLALHYGTSDFTLASATGTVMSALDTGEITYPLQPAFSAYLASNDLNVTGDGTQFVLGSATALTEIYDQGGDFVTSGTFTAPVTGRYFFTTSSSVTGLAAGHTAYFNHIVTSNRTYQGTSINPVATAAGGNAQGNFGAFADMDAADTAHADVQVSGSTLTVDLNGGATVFTFFQGKLVA